MCGIVGYVGGRRAVDIIVAGLHRLEYRGYDSAGVALIANGAQRASVLKTPGKIDDLQSLLDRELAADDGSALLGIGHTRWATHGPPDTKNAHPHTSNDGAFAIVHNGIIENYAGLKQRLSQKGHVFASDTDSEVLAHLIAEVYDGDFRAAVAAALDCVEGTYGIAAVSTHHPGTIIAARKGSPIVVGVCDGETVIASDVSAIAAHTRNVVFLDDGDLVVASEDELEVTNLDNVPVARETTRVDWDVGRIEKGGYEHFMLKEIHEQPEALANCLRGRLLDSEGTSNLNGLRMEAYDLARINRVVVAACGTSLYAGMVGAYCMEDLADIPTDVQQAAEFRYRNPIIEHDTCMLAVSQSGETADTLAAVREALRKGATVLGVCNVVGSTIAREAGRGVYLHAGPEIGVASTKAFTCQVSVLAMIALALGRTRRLSVSEGRSMVKHLSALPEIAKRVLEQNDTIREIAECYAGADDFFFIGRGYMYPAALEGALKLKEISYIHAEGYHAAELKHGPIALLTPEVPVVAVAPDIPGKSKTIGNMQECRARQSPVIAIATEGDAEIDAHCDAVIRIPPCREQLAAIPVVIAEQLFAYHVAHLRGCAIDQPRNLAKSVTVE